MIAHEFEYMRPKTLDEALEVLAKPSSRAQVLAGGTDLMGWMRDDLVAPDVVVDIKDIAGLKEIEFSRDTLFIGALVTFSELIESRVVRERFPLLVEMARTVGSPGIRNRATIVGNICSAVPSCDSGPVLLVYEADVLVVGRQAKRRIGINEWFLGPKETALREGEIVTGLGLPYPAKGNGGSWVKLGRYRGEDLAQASVAVLALPGNGYRVAFGAVAPTPVRARKIEALLNDRELQESLIQETKGLVPQEVAPISDIRASREYRSHMVEVMLERGIKAAAARLKGKGPAYGTSLI